MTQSARIIELPKVIDERGNLSFVEARKHIPFGIARAYWIYDIPGGEQRGSHAFRRQQELIIALSGSFDVELDNGSEQQTFSLNRSFKALYVPNMTWRTLKNFSTNALCLIISSHTYHEGDYIRDYDLFKSELSVNAPTIEKVAAPVKKIHPSNARKNTVFDCTLIEFPVIPNRAGNLTPVHTDSTIPFSIERLFYIYDIPSGASRGMHAHTDCHEVLVAASGSFDVELDDGTNKRTVRLNRPKYGLHIPPGVWATETEYSSGAICIALASHEYSNKGYIHTYDDFIKYRNSGSQDL